MTKLVTSRRSFFMGLGAALAAPAIVPYANLMPVRAIAAPWDGPGHFILAKQIGPHTPLGVVFPLRRQPPNPWWLRLDGKLHRVADHPELAKYLGAAFGGDGVHTFAVPDVRNYAEFQF